MLVWGIPFYPLPADPLNAENQRILDLGVELKLGTTIGNDVPVEELKKRHQVIIVGIGAHKGKFMRGPREAAPREEVTIELAGARVEVKGADGKVRGIIVERMELGEPDDSGRRRPVPIQGSEYEIPVDSIIAAISQEPDWGPLNELKPAKGVGIQPDADGTVAENVWAGGDVLGLAR